MVKVIHSGFLIFLVFNLVILLAMAGRDLPGKNLKKPEEDVKHPETFFSDDGGYLIPGLGRGIKPKSGKGFNPFTYNPITGDNNGIPVPGLTIPGGGDVGSGGGGGDDNDIPGFVGGGSYVPGGDDTLGPNPGVEVPDPVYGYKAPPPYSS